MTWNSGRIGKEGRNMNKSVKPKPKLEEWEKLRMKYIFSLKNYSAVYY